MRVLLLHPEDSLGTGDFSASRWTRGQWDLVVDLGFAGPVTYQEWSRDFGVRVVSIYEFAGETESFRWVNQVVELGRGRLLDRTGLDWWEILAMESHQDLQAFYLLNRLRREIPASDPEIVASRPHRLATLFEKLAGQPVRCFPQQQPSFASRLMGKGQSARNLRPTQIAEIALDKWDTGYQLRRHLTKPQRARLSSPAVLLPSAYSNVTRSAVAYAAQLPQRKFLLITTRRSARPGSLPVNVVASPLAAYAGSRSATHTEAAELIRAWEVFLRTMKSEAEEFRHAADAGLWDYFPIHLRHGLHLREAWKQVLDSEPVTGVLCGDDLNYHTRLPLMLAQRRGLHAVYCSHGALDGGFLFKKPAADCFLVKGEMERDYLQRARAISPEKIHVGAPGGNVLVDRNDQADGALVFFSQPYEVDGGRADSIYREILPPLCSAARQSGRRVIVKLHPFESQRARQALVTSIMPKESSDRVSVVSRMPIEDIMASAWCGVTIDSSVAVEGARRGIPFFLCGWLDFGGMGYLQQFARFGVGRVLAKPEEMEHIPRMVAEFQPDPATRERLWREAKPELLDEIMFGARQVHLDPCVC